jgi:Skp family chaperone for outer membrane proteins
MSDHIGLTETRNMRSIYTLPAIVLTIFLTASVSMAQTVKVAVISPVQVFQKMAETQDLKEKMKAEEAARKTTGDEKSLKIRKLQEELQQLKPDSPAYSDKMKELRAAQIEASVWDKITSADAEGRENEQSLALFRKIESAVAEIAKAKGIDVVISDNVGALPENVTGATKQQFTQFMSQKTVWYSSPAVDLTNDVLAKLDADYKAAKK